jgi:lambda family phage portal protein
MNLEIAPNGKYTAFGYKAAKTSRESVNSPIQLGTTTDWHLRQDLPTLRARMQQLDRDNWIISNLINRCVANVLGAGFVLNACTGDDQLDKAIEAYWYEWCKNPENSNKYNFASLEEIALRAILVDGDIGLLKTNTGKLSVIEADRIYSTSRNAPNGNIIESGIEINSFGAPLNFYITTAKNGYIQRAGAVPYKAEDMIYLGYFTRPSQTRGVSPLVATLPLCMMLEDILTSEAISRQIQARIALIINRNDAAAKAYLDSEENTAATENRQQPQRVTEWDKGITFNGEIGETVAAMPRTAPGDDIDKVVDVYLSQIGVVLGLSLELIKLNYAGVNFSASKASLAQSYATFRRYQNLMIDRFHDKAFEWKIKEGIAKGLFPNTKETFKHSWDIHNPPTLDPYKEAQAADLNIKNGLASVEEIHNQQNKDTDSIIKQNSEYIQKLIEAAAEINKKYPDVKLDWRELRSLTNAGTKPNEVPSEDVPQVEDDDKEDNEV